VADVLARATALTRSFGSRVAVHDVSFALHAGEIVALLGPNGAGKTTTIRLLAGLIRPSQGEVELGGERLTAATADELRGRVGLLTESPGLWDRLSVRVNLLTHARLQGIDQPDAAVDRTLAQVGVADRASDPAGALSKGLRQRVAIARALLHDPPILLLDEPTSGLDPSSARHVRDLIVHLRSKGRAVLVSTHNLTEADELADRIAVLKTRLLALDAPSRLRQMREGACLDIELEGPPDPWLDLLRVLARRVDSDGPVATLLLHDAADTPDIVRRLVEAGARVRRVTPAERTLEDVYLSLVRDGDGVA
jgi:ABC-2 type transport system ATP-binding protein